MHITYTYYALAMYLPMHLAMHVQMHLPMHLQCTHNAHAMHLHYTHNAKTMHPQCTCKFTSNAHLMHMLCTCNASSNAPGNACNHAPTNALVNAPNNAPANASANFSHVHLQPSQQSNNELSLYSLSLVRWIPLSFSSAPRGSILSHSDKDWVSGSEWNWDPSLQRIFFPSKIDLYS